MFLDECPGNKRDKPTLVTIILNKTGTLLLTDGWAAYRDIERHGDYMEYVLVSFKNIF